MPSPSVTSRKNNWRAPVCFFHPDPSQYIPLPPAVPTPPAHHQWTGNFRLSACVLFRRSNNSVSVYCSKGSLPGWSATSEMIVLTRPTSNTVPTRSTGTRIARSNSSVESGSTIAVRPRPVYRTAGKSAAGRRNPLSKWRSPANGLCGSTTASYRLCSKNAVSSGSSTRVKKSSRPVDHQQQFTSLRQHPADRPQQAAFIFFNLFQQAGRSLDSAIRNNANSSSSSG